MPQQLATAPILAPGAHIATTGGISPNKLDKPVQNDMGLQAQLQHQIQPHQTQYVSMNTALPGSIVAASQLTAATYPAAMLPGGMHQQQQRPVTATPGSAYGQQQSVMPMMATSAAASFPVVSASDTDGGGGVHQTKRAKRGGKGSLAAMPSAISDFKIQHHAISAGESTAAETDPNITEEDQKLLYNRERNREHAKNTRLRKKAYVERLKISVDELCRERDTLVSERATAADLMVEIHAKRVDVLRSFFALRGSYTVDQKRELWSSILDESSFTCRMPVTPYQSFPSSEVQVSNCQRTIVGVDSMINDAAANYVFLDSIVDRARFPEGKIKFQYTLVTEESVVAGNQLMARWAMSTLNAKRQCGACAELHQRGMLICKFNSAHKIVSLEIMFDVMAFMLQVKMAMGFDNFNDVVIPNTVQTCQKAYDYPMVMTLANRPYTIVQVNERWENLTGYKRSEVVGKHSCSILQGAVSDGTRAGMTQQQRKEIDQLMGPVLFKRPSCAMLTNCTKSGRRYRQYVTIYPLSTDSNISHYFGLTTFVQWMDAPPPDKGLRTMNDPSQSLDNGSKGSAAEGPNTDTREPNSRDDTISSAKPMHAPQLVAGSKQSLSSLTSSVSSSSNMSSDSNVGAGNKSNGTVAEASNNNISCDSSSMAAAAPSNSSRLTGTSPSKQKVVEFSVPLTKLDD